MSDELGCLTEHVFEAASAPEGVDETVPDETTDLYLDCHLMISNPGDLLDAFAAAGADGCTVHIELGDPRPHFEVLRRLGVTPAMAAQ